MDDLICSTFNIKQDYLIKNLKSKEYEKWE